MLDIILQSTASLNPGEAEVCSIIKFSMHPPRKVSGKKDRSIDAKQNLQVYMSVGPKESTLNRRQEPKKLKIEMIKKLVHS